jgi:hypothetical protein
MGKNLPDRLGDPSSAPTTYVRSGLILRNGETEVFRHGVRTSVNSAKERIDAMAASDATQFCLAEELNVLAYGKSRAGNDPDAQAIVRRKVNGLADRNDRRLDRRYG